jgi:hypothetical protein
MSYDTVMAPLYLVNILLGIALICLAIWVFILERRIAKLLTGKSGASLEDTIDNNRSEIAKLFDFKKDAEDTLLELDSRMRKKLHGVKTLRFNPFAGSGTGGNQSFATALLDEDGDGVVLSTLYSREKVSIFAKPIKKKMSEFELTEEEREVLK